MIEVFLGTLCLGLGSATLSYFFYWKRKILVAEGHPSYNPRWLKIYYYPELKKLTREWNDNLRPNRSIIRKVRMHRMRLYKSKMDKYGISSRDIIKIITEGRKIK